MKRKRILLNASMVTKSISGVGVYSVEMINQLVPLLEKKNISFDVFCYYNEYFQSLRNVKKISLGLVLDSLLLKKITLHRHLWNIVILHFIGRKYDLIYSPSSHGTLSHQKQIITIHDLISLAFPQQHKSQYLYFKKYIPSLLKKSKRIITISNFTKSEVLKYYTVNEANIKTIYNGIDHFEDTRSVDAHIAWVNSVTMNNPFCLVIGLSYPHKNVITILQVAKRMQEQGITFVLVGKYDKYFKHLLNICNDMKLKNVIFLDDVNKGKIAALYKLARINLYLSLYEGFGFPPAEASYFRTQSLLSNNTVLVEIYNSNFEFCDPLDIEKIEAIVNKYILSEKKIETNSYSALKQKYNWNQAAEEVVQLFVEVLN